MKKSLLAIAIAAALPAVASAQVTISGYAKGSVDSFSIGNALSSTAANAAANATAGTAGQTGRLGKTSESRVTDHSSRIIFSAVEQIDNDLSGVFQYDLRFSVDQTARAGNEGAAATGAYTGVATATTAQKLDGWMANPGAVANPLSSGNNHVGIVSKSMGALRIGRQDIYYGVTGSVMPSSVHINASAPTIMHSPAPGVAMANFSRTPNLVWYTSPTIQGWSATAAYSTNPLRVSGTNETENDLSTTGATRRGDGTFFQVNGQVGPVALTFATVNLKSDYFGGACTNSDGKCVYETIAGANTNPNQKGNALSAIYRSGPIALGVGYAQNKATFSPNATSNANAKFERDSFNLSAAYTMGKNTFAIERQTANDWNRNGVKGAETGATGTVLAWDYAFSKRTNIGLTYFALDNGDYSALGPFYSGSNTFGGHFAAKNGETYKLTSFVMRHSW